MLILCVMVCPVCQLGMMLSSMEQLPVEKKEADEIRNNSHGTTLCESVHVWRGGEHLVYTHIYICVCVYVYVFLCICKDLKGSWNIFFLFLAPSEWRTMSDPKQAARTFSQELFQRNKNSKSLFLSLDIRQDKVDQDRSLVAFYSRNNVTWASPLCCKLHGKKKRSRQVLKVKSVIFGDF